MNDTTLQTNTITVTVIVWTSEDVTLLWSPLEHVLFPLSLSLTLSFSLNNNINIELVVHLILRNNHCVYVQCLYVFMRSMFMRRSVLFIRSSRTVRRHTNNDWSSNVHHGAQRSIWCKYDDWLVLVPMVSSDHRTAQLVREPMTWAQLRRYCLHLVEQTRQLQWLPLSLVASRIASLRLYFPLQSIAWWVVELAFASERVLSVFLNFCLF